MALLTMQRHVPVDRRVAALGVGAGLEPTSFIFTKYFDRVFATDLYGSGGWRSDTPRKMLTKPEQCAGPVPFDRRRLVVQHMNALDLRYEDNSFDFIYSSSSIEHFGSPGAIGQAAAEMGRVLRPGGILSLSTEFRCRGTDEWPRKSTFVFDNRSLQELVVKPSGCRPIDSPDFSISQETLDHPTEFWKALLDLKLKRKKGTLQGRWSVYPHIVIGHRALKWTSVHLALRKP